MARKIDIAALCVAVLGVVVALLAWLRPVSAVTDSMASNVPFQSMVESKRTHDSTLKVSGTASHVVIKVGISGSWYNGGLISATGAKSVIYLPIGQRLKITLTGTGSVLEIDSKLMPYVQVSNLASGSSVVEI